jgi:hypothetical protein
MRKKVTIVALLGLVGMVAGLLFTSVHESRYASRSVVLVARLGPVRPLVAIAHSDPVRIQAQRQTHLAIKPGDVQVHVFHGNFIAIIVQAARPDWAQRETTGIDISYLTYLHPNAPQRAVLVDPAQPGYPVRPFSYVVTGLLGLLAGLSAALGFLVPPRSRVTAMPA